MSGDGSTIYYKHADIKHKGGYDTRGGYGGILLTRNKSGGGYVTVKWVTTPKSYSSSSIGVRLEEFIW